MEKGSNIFDVFKPHCDRNDDYVFGALTAVGLRDPKVFDCSKAASWATYWGSAQSIIYGTQVPNGDPMKQYGWTHWWYTQAQSRGKIITVAQAKHIKGALLLRIDHHIAISDGNCGTAEAQCTATGCVFDTAEGRRWDIGIAPAGLEWPAIPDIPPHQNPIIYRVTSPYMRSLMVEEIQKRLLNLGFKVTIDGIYGNGTASAVENFQNWFNQQHPKDQDEEGLVVDGEAGPRTLKALGINIGY